MTPTEERTARLTVLIDPRKKAVFERICAAEDTTPSQVVRRLIRGYIEEQLGQACIPSADLPLVHWVTLASGGVFVRLGTSIVGDISGGRPAIFSRKVGCFEPCG